MADKEPELAERQRAASGASSGRYFTQPLEQVLADAVPPPPPAHRVSFIPGGVPLQTLAIDEGYERQYFPYPNTVSLSWVRGQAEGGELTVIVPTVVFPVAKHNVEELDGIIQHGIASHMSQ